MQQRCKRSWVEPCSRRPARSKGHASAVRHGRSRMHETAVPRRESVIRFSRPSLEPVLKAGLTLSFSHQGHVVRSLLCQGEGGETMKDPRPSQPAPGSVKLISAVLSVSRRRPCTESKRRCGHCPHFSPLTGPYNRRTGPDSPGFRDFPAMTRVGIAFESHLGHSIPLVRGGFCFNMLTIVDTGL